jgi:hypothetical protein
MVNNLEFVYALGLRRDENAESAMRNNVDMWLRPLEKEINEKDIIVGVIFLSHDKRHISLLGADPDLYARFTELMKQFVV